MNTLLKLTLSALLFFSLCLVSGCGEKSPEEKAEDAIEEAANGMEDAIEEAGDAIEDAADEIEDATN